MTETITPCPSSHSETVTSCDFHFTLEVTVQLNVKSQAWKKSFQLLPDCVECAPDNEEWASQAQPSHSAGKKGLPGILEAGSLNSAVDVYLPGGPHR